MNKREVSKVRTLAATLKEHLAEARENFEAEQREAAISKLEDAVVLCEQHPRHSSIECESAVSKLKDILADIVRIAVMVEPSDRKARELLARIEAIAGVTH